MIATLGEAELKVLHSIFCSPEPTRSTISADAGFSIVKTTNIVNSLGKAGFIENIGKTPTSGGRPSYVYHTSTKIGYAVGMSVWHDHILTSVVDSGGAIVHEETVPLDLPPDPDAHGEEVIESICRGFASLRARFASTQELVCLGLSLPGMVDSERGIWLQGLQLSGIYHLPIADELEKRLGVPTYAEDAARAVTFLALRRAPTSSVDHFIVLYLGFGMGTGVVINRHIYSGVRGLAGEIGHIEHANNDYRCSCNNVGCLETVLSIQGILRLFADRLRAGVQSSLQSVLLEERSDGLTLTSILAAAREGDRFTLMTLAEVGAFIGDSCAMLVKMFNPSYVVITGPLSLFKDYFSEAVNRVVARELLPEMSDGYDTIFEDYRTNDEACGAALTALDRYIRACISRFAQASS